MNLVSAKEITTFLGLKRWGGLGLLMAKCVMRLLQLHKINALYEKHKTLDALSFLNAIIADLKINYTIPEKDLEKIPKEGSFITISNHPLGAIDGIILLKVLLEKNTDFKLMGNFLLERIEPLKNHIIPINPFENRPQAYSNYSSLKKALLHIKEGNTLGVFPAGEVSFRKGTKIIDRSWTATTLKLIKNAQVPVIPIYFQAKNSWLFYLLARASKSLQTAKLPSEIFKQGNKQIRLGIGDAIPLKKQKEFNRLKDLTQFLRSRTYLLGQKFIHKQTPASSETQIGNQTIAPAVTKEALLDDIIALRASNYGLLNSSNYELFLVKAHKIPNILLEIGRLREITFRAAGEGTQTTCDLDQFDDYYYHLFLWDQKAEGIVGAYRIGLGSQIYEQKGVQGFYLSQLFYFEPELYNLLETSIELGRAFVVEAYQKRPLPLILLWKGIVLTALRFPEHKHLIGSVSISNQFSDFSKSLMIEFMKSHYWDPFIAQYVRPKKAYKVHLKDVHKEIAFDTFKADLNKFDKLIAAVESGNLRLPVLIKKYIEQNAKVIAFSVDPRFNNAIDGLMYIKIADLPENTVQPIFEEFEDLLKT